MAAVSLAFVAFGSHPSLRRRRRNLTVRCSQDYITTSQQHAVHLEAETYAKRIEQLKQGVREGLFNGSVSIDNMRKVDTLQHLGIGYHFEKEIDAFLDQCFKADSDEYDLFSSALRFRLLRGRGYNINSDVFHKFTDSKGKFRESFSKNLLGLLSLHEASYMGARDEEVLTQAMEFSRQHLKSLAARLDHNTARDVDLALELPRHRRMGRLAARSYMEKHATLFGTSSVLLELATLDFNMVQSAHQREIAELIQWWRELGLAKKLTFARDRPLECFLWTVGMFPEPCFARCRIEVAKAVAILLVLDDVYDSYGSPHELALFTDAIQRWDIYAIEQLPEYMRIVYMALYNTTNDTGYRVFKEYGWFIVPHLRNTWIDICKAFLVEAKWFSGGVVPKLEDYLSNGITTAGTYMALVHAFFLMGREITRENISLVSSYPKLFTSSGGILRLWDDLGTARAEQERGDVASSIECYLEEHPGLSENDARLHVRKLTDCSWEDLNGLSIAMAALPRSIVEASLN